jgi:hypothetical protein
VIDLSWVLCFLPGALLGLLLVALFLFELLIRSCVRELELPERRKR